jgi:hypothetical protein
MKIYQVVKKISIDPSHPKPATPLERLYVAISQKALIFIEFISFHIFGRTTRRE